jgi:hypothetical protein
VPQARRGAGPQTTVPVAQRQARDEGPVIDDSEFIPLVESVLTACETTGFDSEVVEELWEYAYSRYDRACQEADPSFTSQENKELMQSYLLGPRRRKRRRR